MKRLRWWLSRHGAPFALAAGLALAGLAALLQGLAVRPLDQQVDTLQSQRARRDATLDRLGEALARSDTPQAQLDGFYAHFADGASLSTGLERVHAIARKHGLEMKRAEYRLIGPAGQKLQRYRMVVPVQGSYPTVRAFLTTALRELPTLALDQVQLQRKDIAEGALEAQITFTFYLAR